SIDELEDERANAVRILETVNGGDVLVIQRGEDLSFAFEAREAVGVNRELGRENLQRDIAIELCVACAIHLAHPAAPKGGKDFERAQSRAGCKGHERVLAIAR